MSSNHSDILPLPQYMSRVCFVFRGSILFYPDPKPCLSLNLPRRSSKMFPIYKKKLKKSALTNMKAVWHIAQKQAHLLTLEHTVNTRRAGSTSCRVHGLEMRNMIHFLSMLDSHASTVDYNEIQQFEQFRGKVLNMTYGLDLGECMCWVTRCRHHMLTPVLILCSWSRSKIASCSSTDSTGSANIQLLPPATQHIHLLCTYRHTHTNTWE